MCCDKYTLRLFEMINCLFLEVIQFKWKLWKSCETRFHLSNANDAVKYLNCHFRHKLWEINANIFHTFHDSPLRLDFRLFNFACLFQPIIQRVLICSKKVFYRRTSLKPSATGRKWCCENVKLTKWKLINLINHKKLPSSIAGFSAIGPIISAASTANFCASKVRCFLLWNLKNSN